MKYVVIGDCLKYFVRCNHCGVSAELAEPCRALPLYVFQAGACQRGILESAVVLEERHQKVTCGVYFAGGGEVDACGIGKPGVVGHILWL